MRRKPQAKLDPVIPAGMLEKAKLAISPDSLKKPESCSVCGASTLAAGEEPLCWVCRRLKISAWRETDQQMPVQE